MSTFGVVLNSQGFGYTATSSSSVTVGTGSKTFTVSVQLAYRLNQTVLVYSTGTAAWMLGTVTFYAGTTLIANITNAVGSGSHVDWNISLSGIGAPFSPSGWNSITSPSFSPLSGANAPRYRIEADGVTVRLSGAITAISGSLVINAFTINFGASKPAHSCVMYAYDTANSCVANISVGYSSFFGGAQFNITSHATNGTISLEGLTFPLN